MAGRRLWVIAAVWLLTVAAASTVTWTVIASAGARVGNPVRLVTTTPSGPQRLAVDGAGTVYVLEAVTVRALWKAGSP